MQKWLDAKEKTCFTKSFSQIKHDLVRQVPSKHWADVIFATITDHLSPRSTSRAHRADTRLVWMFEVISRSLLKNSSGQPDTTFCIWLVEHTSSKPCQSENHSQRRTENLLTYKCWSTTNHHSSGKKKKKRMIDFFPSLWHGKWD